MKTEKYENEFVTIKIEEGILYATYLVNKIDLEGAKAATEFRKKITGNRVFPALVDVSSFKEINREARAFFAQEAGEDLKAIAVLVKNPVSRMMTNFFLKFNNPKYPIRFFTSDSEAYQWLLQYVDLNQDNNGRNKIRHNLL